MKKLLGLLFVSLLLMGCSEKEYFKQVYLEDVEDYMEKDKDGFILLVTDTDENFQDYVKDVAESEEIEIVMYNVYQSEEGKEDERPVLPYKDFGGFSKLFYVADNEVQGELEVKSYADLKLTEEIMHFVKLHK